MEKFVAEDVRCIWFISLVMRDIMQVFLDFANLPSVAGHSCSTWDQTTPPTNGCTTDINTVGNRSNGAHIQNPCLPGSSQYCRGTAFDRVGYGLTVSQCLADAVSPAQQNPRHIDELSVALTVDERGISFGVDTWTLCSIYQAGRHDPCLLCGANIVATAFKVEPQSRCLYFLALVE